MKMIMVVPKSAWGKDDHEIEEAIERERLAEEERRRREEESAKSNSLQLVQPAKKVKTLKEIALELIDKKLALPDKCCLRPENCCLFKAKCIQKVVEYVEEMVH